MKIDDSKIETIICLLGGGVYFKQLSPERKSIKVSIHPTLRKILEDSGINTNHIINKLLGTEKIKASYLNDDHINFISANYDTDGKNIVLNYVTLESLKKSIRSFFARNDLLTEKGANTYLSDQIKKLRNKSIGRNTEGIRSGMRFIRTPFPRIFHLMYNLFHSEKLEKNAAEEFKNTAKLGKGINKLFNKKDVQAVEQFVDIVRVALTQERSERENNIEIVCGQEIPYYYNVSQYITSKRTRRPLRWINMLVAAGGMGAGGMGLLNANNEEEDIEGCGSLGHSCMRGSSCSRSVAFYGNNPETISLLIYKDSEDKRKIAGRALLWKSTNGKTYIDRIYAANNEAVVQIAAYAKKNNFISISCSNNKILPLDETAVVKVKLQRWADMEVPFMDSMRYINVRESIMSNIRYNTYDTFLRLSSGATYYDSAISRGIKRGECCVTKKEFTSTELINVDSGKHAGKRCHFTKALYLLYNREFVTVDDINNIVIGVDFLNRKTAILKDKAVYSKCMKEYIPREHAVYIPEFDDYATDIRYVYVNGEFVVSDKLEKKCKQAGIYYEPTMKLLIGLKVKLKAEDLESPIGIYLEDYFIPFTALEKVTPENESK